MNDEEMLVDFISKYMNSEISENDFEDGVNSLARPDANQMKAFYVNAFSSGIQSDATNNILGTITSSDEHVNQTISEIGEGNTILKTCLEILYSLSKNSQSGSSGLN